MSDNVSCLPRETVSYELKVTPCQRFDPELWFARRESCGVWGGQIFAGGVVIPDKRGRGRRRGSGHEGWTASCAR